MLIKFKRGWGEGGIFFSPETFLAECCAAIVLNGQYAGSRTARHLEHSVSQAPFLKHKKNSNAIYEHLCKALIMIEKEN
jgi:hypothetical protein